MEHVNLTSMVLDVYSVQVLPSSRVSTEARLWSSHSCGGGGADNHAGHVFHTAVE